VPGFDDPSWNYWWGDYTATAGGSVAWGEALYGISGLIPSSDFSTVDGMRYIEANGFEGFYSDTFFSTTQPPRTEPALPLAVANVSEPATASLALAALLGIWLAWKRRRSRSSGWITPAA